eukprot:c12289_g3_i1.p1 GENE.c12289_g3_i1~~c12289_g3_i1.p1  ORF type:complete len:1135 (+),score=298.90 c12289_g3_i1:203-3607(+)
MVTQFLIHFVIWAVVVLVRSEETAIEWGYIDNPDTTTTCGNELLGEDVCGPNHWEVFAECAIKGSQSPINIDLPHIHASHELDELRWAVNECKNATMTLNTHNWRVELGEDCAESFKISRFDSTYHATSLEFHSPSEHTFDDEHLSLEVQIEHVSGTHRLIVAVVLEASEEYKDNSFLASFWEIAEKIATASASEAELNSTTTFESNNLTLTRLPTFPTTSLAHHFSEGDLNFVDNLLPSHGLNFDYVLYEGSSTSPDCVEVKWVVLKYPGRMSLKQLEFFLSTMVSIDKTKARTDGSNNRPIQEVGSRHPELFHDSDCYIRFCHQVFALGELLSFPFIGLYIILLIVFTMIFEALSHYAEHKVARLRTAREMLAKVYKELSVLGLVSFLTFAINSSCAVSFNGTGVEFEFAHIMLFAVAILYVCFSGLLMVFTSYASTVWDKVLSMQGPELIAFVESPRYRIIPTSWAIFGHVSQTLDLGVFYLHHLFIQQHGLPENFDFLKYLKYCLSHNIKQQLDIGWLEWIRIIIILVVWGLICYFGNIHIVYGPIGIFSVVVVTGNWILCILSFKRLLKMQRVMSYEGLVSRVRSRVAREVKADSIISMIQGDGDGDARKRLEAMLSPRKLMSKQSLGAETDKNKAKDFAKQLGKCWIPGGSSALIRALADTALLSMCFYAGFFMLNARLYLSSFQSFLTIFSIIVVVCLLLPAIYLIITMIGSLVEPNFDLIGEVLEYTDELQQLRTNLVNTLFPELDNRLLSDMTMEEAEELLSYFDMDGDCNINVGEFARGCQVLGLRMSESKARRFFRMVDVDRNAIIDGHELFGTIFEERLDRIDKLLVRTFRSLSSKKGSAEVPDKIPQKEIASALKKTFRSDDKCTKERIQELTAQVIQEILKKKPDFESQPDIHILELRQALVRVLTASKLDVAALLESIKTKKKQLTVLQVWAMKASLELMPKKLATTLHHSDPSEATRQTFAARHSIKTEIEGETKPASESRQATHISRRRSEIDVKQHKEKHHSKHEKSGGHRDRSTSEVQRVSVGHDPARRSGTGIVPQNINNTNSNTANRDSKSNDTNAQQGTVWGRIATFVSPRENQRSKSGSKNLANAAWDDDAHTVANTIAGQTPVTSDHDVV